MGGIASRSHRRFLKWKLSNRGDVSIRRMGIAAHAIGYVGEISEAELDLPQFIDYHPGDIIGKDGIETRVRFEVCAASTASAACWWTAWAASGRWTSPKKPWPAKICS